MTGIDIISRVSSGKLGHQAGAEAAQAWPWWIRVGTVQPPALAPAAGRVSAAWPHQTGDRSFPSATSYPLLALVPVSRGLLAWRVVI